MLWPWCYSRIALSNQFRFAPLHRIAFASKTCKKMTIRTKIEQRQNILPPGKIAGPQASIEDVAACMRAVTHQALGSTKSE